ncbi:MAG: hypothetical protein ACM3ME_06580 [Chloroflexota bacterium]|jgi:hypothetical protein|nr:hypothetical protein [Lentimicrobium sp.]
MKTKTKSLLFILTITILSALTIVSGCKKDNDDDNDNPVVKSYRLTDLDDTDGSDAYKTKVQYTSDNKVSKILGYVNGVNVYKSEWTYSGNDATVQDWELTEVGWVADSGFTKYVYANGHISQVILYNAGDSVDFSKTYTWNGNNLNEEQVTLSDSYLGTGEELVFTIKYNYEGGLLKSADWLLQGVMIRKQVIEYLNNSPVALKSYDYNNVLEESTQFIYTGSNISKVNYFKVSDGTQGAVDCFENRSYDANKNVSSVSKQCDGDLQSYTTNITWEEGTGNLQDVFLTSYSYISAYLFPDYPSEFAIKKK